MIKNYKCIEGFFVDNYDGDGFFLDTVSWIEEGTIFEYDTKDRSRVVGADDIIRLVNDTKWLELTKDTVKKYFEEVVINNDK